MNSISHMAIFINFGDIDPSEWPIEFGKSPAFNPVAGFMIRV